MTPVFDADWDDWEEHIRALIEVGEQNEATAEVLRMAGYILDQPCSPYGASICRDLMNEFALSFSYWLDDDEDD
jgi:hypothetical protein